MGKYLYHLDLNEKIVKGARFAFLPGDPGRVPLIASRLDDSFQLASNREFCTYLGRLAGENVLVTSTGIGGPSTSIAIEELAQLGVDTFIRVGSTGAIQKNIGVKEIIITTGSVRLDGASSHYASIEYPAVAHHEVVQALVEASNNLGISAHVGITASSDTFYPGQERYDSYSGYVKRSLQGSMAEFQRMNVLNYEMESAAVLTMTSVFNLRAGCVMGVVVNRTSQEKIDGEAIKEAENNAISVAISAMRKLVSS